MKNFKPESLKGRIFSWLTRRWTWGWRVGEFAGSEGYSPSNGERRARELAEDGYILSREVVTYTYHNNKRHKVILVQFRRK